MSLVILRGVAVLALILLVWNPASSRLLPAGDQPLVLLDASLSMNGAPWRAALDSARNFARRRAVVWRFGSAVTAFDTAPPTAGASHLAPTLEAAAARAGEVVVVTDGEIDDVAAIPADLLRRPRVIVQRRGDTTPYPHRYDSAQSELRRSWDSGLGTRGGGSECIDRSECRQAAADVAASDAARQRHTLH